MKRQEIIDRIKALDLPEASYVVFGGAPLAIAGLREAGDIDLLVSKEVFDHLQKQGWQLVHKGPNDEPVTHGVFEAHQHWGFSFYSPTLEYLLKTATYVDGVPIASLKEVRKWKAASARAKDLADIKLIDDYLVAD